MFFLQNLYNYKRGVKGAWPKSRFPIFHQNAQKFVLLQGQGQKESWPILAMKSVLQAGAQITGGTAGYFSSSIIITTCSFI
jgi:hypothetical protein